MIHYKDRAWCVSYSMKECANHNCDRALTRREREQARTWWGSDTFPISLSNFKSDTCGFIPMEVEELTDDD